MANRLLKFTGGLVCVLATHGASAADWGCEVLLCLANPAGPMAAPYCVPPITRLYKAIFKPKPDPFPTCAMSGGTNNSYAYVAPPSFYDPCPVGLQALPEGVFAAKGQYVQRTTYFPFTPGYEVSGNVFVGIGESAQQGYSTAAGESASLPQKICVTKKLGEATQYPASTFDNTAPDPVRVNIFEKVLPVNPAGSSFSINVVVNNQLVRNVRP